MIMWLLKPSNPSQCNTVLSLTPVFDDFLLCCLPTGVHPDFSDSNASPSKVGSKQTPERENWLRSNQK